MSNGAKSLPSGHTPDPHLAGASNVLMLFPALSQSEYRYCTDLLSTNHHGEVTVLQVEFTRSLDVMIGDWPNTERNPREVKIISVGQQPDPFHCDPLLFGFSIESDVDAGNLTELGVAIISALNEWDDHPCQTVFCFHSLTPLLQYSEFDQVYQFLHKVTGHMRSCEVRAHYHMDPSAHELSTLQKLKSLFDAVIENDDEGTPTITTRR